MKSVKGWVKPHTISKSILVDKFHHKGLLCAIVKMQLFQLKFLKGSLKDSVSLYDEIPKKYHNGYVELKGNISDYQDLQDFIKSVDLTFIGNLPFFDKNIRFIGFDSVHAWNLSNPESRTAEAVKKNVMRLAKEMAKIDWEVIEPLIMARKL